MIESENHQVSTMAQEKLSVDAKTIVKGCRAIGYSHGLKFTVLQITY